MKNIHHLTGVYEKYTSLIQIHACCLLTTHAPIRYYYSYNYTAEQETKYSKFEIVQVNIQIKTGTRPKIEIKMEL